MRRLAWLASALIISSGASAQDAVAWYDPALKETPNSTVLIDAVGECVSQSPIWLRRFKPASGSIKKSGELVRNCVRKITDVDYLVPNSILAGSVARGYYIKRFSVAPIANDAPFFGESHKGREEKAANFLFFDCVLKSAPVSADKLVRSTGSSVEVVLLTDSVATASRSCVAPEGKKIGNQGLKFGLADVLFRRSLPASELVAATSKGAE